MPKDHINFVCKKCVKGDMVRNKNFDRKVGKKKYSYVCNKCGYLAYFEVD
jgi:predicted RNA-binding Zn-ribbon protein involved in translation (DUF1610 family)